MQKILFDILDELEERYIKIWEEVCDIESPTNYKEGVDRVGEYFINLAKEKNFDVEVFRHNVAGDAICITMNNNADASPVILSGHIDTVHPLGLFGEKPTHIEGDRIYGPGVEDCKGGVVASFMAMDALSRAGFSSRPVKLILQSDEETGSKTSNKETIKFMQEKAKGSVAFINTEGKRSNNDVCILRKGIIRFLFSVKGIAGHSSRCYDYANAICEAAHKIIELEKMKNPDGVTCNCGTISGGTVANSVAQECEFLADIRFSSLEELGIVRNKVKEVAEKSSVKGCTCTVSEVSFRPGMYESEKNKKLVEKINEIYKKWDMPLLVPEMGNGGSDAAYITEAGIPCVDNLGVHGGFIHSEKEYADIPSLKFSAKQQALICMEI